MPIYEYQCGKCGTISEVIVLGDEEVVSCKSCKSKDLTKLMSAHNTASSSESFGGQTGGCCGSPNSCGTPGSCCGG